MRAPPPSRSPSTGYPYHLLQPALLLLLLKVEMAFHLLQPALLLLLLKVEMAFHLLQPALLVFLKVEMAIEKVYPCILPRDKSVGSVAS